MTTQLFIPAINDQLTLAQDWTFKLFREHRNEGLFAALGLLGVKREVTVTGTSTQYQGGVLTPVPYSYTSKQWPIPPGWWDAKQADVVTLPSGTILTVRRIYVRQGLVDYNSVTFSIHKCPANKKLKGRFWVKLYDVNNMLVEEVDSLRAQQVAIQVARKMGVATMSGKLHE